MFLLYILGWLPHKVFRFGGGHVTRYTVFECKWLFSIYFHHLAMDVQDRFHTHAFNAVSFVLMGGYTESVKRGLHQGASQYDLEFIAPTVRYIPRLMNHKLLKARADTLSLIIAGPYADMWTEELDDGTFRILGSGHQLLRSS